VRMKQIWQCSQKPEHPCRLEGDYFPPGRRCSSYLGHHF
jgi:hypothetical protein